MREAVKGRFIAARILIGLVISIGVLADCRLLAQPFHPTPLFFFYLVLALLSSGLKVSLPGVTGTMSVSFLFILAGLLELDLSRTLIIGLGSALVQIYWHARKRPPVHQVLFNLAVISIAITAANQALSSPLTKTFGGSIPVKLFLATVGYFVVNTSLVTCVIAVTESKKLISVWRDCYVWAFPYYLLNATIVCLIHWVNVNLGVEFSLLAVPAAWVMYRSYRLNIGRLETEKAYAEEMNALHLRTIKALALAIEAKDQTTHNHLRRVEHYAVGIGKDLGLNESELQALRAASLLHDIGKLAIPEHIITKPGKLTPQEYEKMKIHPIVGAEILEQVNFPYPVAPIVRAHHEKWDGNGYPLGLAGEEIPLGARILSAVDCLDALASDRQYRRAVPIDQAMEIVRRESGKSYDPRVVEALERRYRGLEAEAIQQNKSGAKLSLDARIRPGNAPATGLDSVTQEVHPATFSSQIAAAGREAQYTLELVSELGNSLSMSEMLSVLSSRLTQLIPCDAIAVYECKHGQLIPVYVDGKDRRLFSSLQIPLGEGLSGWVALHNKHILNGNPSVEPGYLNDPKKFSLLRSALSVPLAGQKGTLGALTLYRAGADAFAADDLRVLSGISNKIGLSCENALKYRALEESATTDYLTGLNNARALFDRLNAEVARCELQQASLAVVVCDLDGFKAVNDRFGHNAGNKVLQAFAQGLGRICRDSDVTARFGGDEFVLVLPFSTPESVASRARALSDLASEACRTVCGESIIAASVGVATFPEDGATGDELVEEADLRMYAHKSSRKNRVMNRVTDRHSLAVNSTP
jgi:diguanylate cyclase (GGDEF)-like protein/putative nucleotidyltransferase with HDIG domain